MKAKKWLVVLLSLAMAVCMGIGLAACSKKETKPDHTYATTWSHDATDHWHACTTHPNDTTDVKDKAAHVDTENGGDGKCDVCNADVTPPAPEHVYAEGWSHDATNHWHACETHPDDPNDVTGKAAHVDVENGGDGKCDVCNADVAKPAPEHVYSEDWSHDATNHWHACETHPDDPNDVTGKAAHVDTENGGDGKCDVCNADVAKPEPTLQAGWYMVGTVADLGITWDDGKYNKVGYVGDGITVNLAVGDDFKFNKFSGGDDATIVWENNPSIGYSKDFAKWFSNNGGNFKVKEGCNGSYTFTIDADSTLHVHTEVEGHIEKPNLQNGWYIVGSVASLGVNWNEFVSAGYIPAEGLTVEFAVGDLFKFAKYDNYDTADIEWEPQICWEDKYTDFDKEGDYQPNFKVREAATYLIVISTDGQLTLTKQGEDKPIETSTMYFQMLEGEPQAIGEVDMQGEQGKHYHLEIALKTGDVFYFYLQTGDNTDYTSFKLDAFWTNDNLVKTTEVGYDNLEALKDGTYIFDIYVGTKNDVDKPAHIDVTLKSEEKPEPVLQAGWYLVGAVKSLSTVNWENYVAEGYIGENGLTVTLAATDNFKFAKCDGKSSKVEWTGSISYTESLKTHFMPSGDNIAVKETCEGEYTFKISTSGVLSFETKVEGNDDKPDLPAGWYIVGDVISLGGMNWGTYAKDRYIPAEGLEVKLAVTDTFKFLKYNGDGDIKVAWDVDKEINYYSGSYSTLFTSPADNNFKAKAAGTYKFTITNDKLTITKDGQTVDPTPTPGDTEKVTVHYHNTKGLTTIYVYTWYTEPSQYDILGKWPGENKTSEITKEADGWITFSYDAPKGHVGKDLWIIFHDYAEANNKTTTKSGDILITANECWVNKYDVAFASQDEAIQAETAATTYTYTFYFYNSKGWSQVGIHMWGLISTEAQGWGKVKMTPATSELGDKWFKYTYESVGKDLKGGTFNIIIFNIQSEQSRITVGDGQTPITINTTAFYFHGDKNQKWFTSKDAALGTATLALVEELPLYRGKEVA